MEHVKENMVVIEHVSIELIVDLLLNDMLFKGFRNNVERMGVGPIM